MNYVQALPEHDATIVVHYLAIWSSYGTPPEHLQEDAMEITRGFIERGRRDRQLASFIAFDGEVAAGSVSCHYHLTPYPAVLKPKYALNGYIWSVYVDPAYRRTGVSAKLVEMAIEHLREVGCTSVVLHSSEAGENLYRKLGFELAREMRLKLV
ncbi:GNAT family N-acetyltransferase [Rhizobium cauense]|uniref:GNAT family N-acetyltransferase n=1 Tax=Rhizobium cauense TaxID=1166683 RepID=UPI001C6E632C|nr:GNAT family N-acetyltransferase [Rhizobium cauense]MBW9115615.1 GNAT family N-acetyltransferase [Rhizobium cauense]